MDRLYKLIKTKDDVEHLLSINRRLIYRVLVDMNLINNQDAESAAWQGLWNAIVTFDIFSKNAFSTYAYTVISNAIKDELRKAKAINTVHTIATDFSEHDLQYECYVELDTTENVHRIYELFDVYVMSKTGLNKNVLLVWYGANFETSATNIATVCKCSTSYVCRVQTGFRAFISGKLVGE